MDSVKGSSSNVIITLHVADPGWLPKKCLNKYSLPDKLGSGVIKSLKINSPSPAQRSVRAGAQA